VRMLEFVAAVAALCLVCRLALEESLTWVGWVIAGAIVAVLALVRRPYGALLVLVGTSAMPRFFVELFGWKARPEHFAVAIVSVAVGVWLSRHKLEIRLEKLDYLVLAYVAINYGSSAFASSEPSATLRWALLNNLAILPYFLIRLMVRNPETLRNTFRILLGVGVVESVYVIVCYVSHHVFGSTFGMEFAYLVDVAAPYGSMFEPNLLGAYTGCCAVLGLALYLSGERRTRDMICFLIASLATVVSLSRAALVALIIACAWVFWQARQARNRSRSRTATVVLAFGLILVIAITAVGGVLQERFNNLFSQGLAEETTITRYVVIAEALQEVSRHPLFGTGTASLQLSFDFGKYIPEWAGNATWVGNVIVRILHDTGILGLTVFLSFLVFLGSRIRRGLLQWTNLAPMLIGLSGGAVLYGISFQSTDGTTLAFCWVHLGLLASAASLVNSPGDV
jgi:O-antigen ligase